LLRPPWEIANLSRTELRLPLGKTIAYGVVANALSRSYGCVPFEYPILGPFLRVLQKFHPGRDGLVPRIQLESWKPVVAGDIELSVEATEAVCKRYEITPSDIARVTAAIEGACRLPYYIEDPVFEVLAVTDY